MPNLCENKITIKGSTESLKLVWKEANKERSGLLNALNPMPKELEDTDANLHTSRSIEQGTLQPIVDGYDNWYSWACDNWGTKWDVKIDGLEFIDNGDGTSSISGSFESAWSPPLDAYHYFLENTDNCSIQASFVEWGMGFKGDYINGKVNMEELSLEELEANFYPDEAA